MTPIEEMQNFFKSELKILPTKVGIDQAEEIVRGAESKEIALARLNEVTLQWAKITNEPPFDKMTCEVKKRVIQHQIINDESFSKVEYGKKIGFNSRIVLKWLAKHWETHGELIERKLQREKEEAEFKPCPPEIADKFIDEWKRSLGAVSFKSSFDGIETDIKKIEREDLERVEARKAVRYKTDPEYLAIQDRKMEAARKRGLDKLDFTQLERFEIEGQQIIARSLEEAQEMYVEIF